MRRGVAVFAALVILIVAAVPITLARSSSTHACAARHSHTVLHAAQVRVYRMLRGPDRNYMFACDHTTNIHTRLVKANGHGPEPMLPHTIAVRGRRVAFAAIICPFCGGDVVGEAEIVTVRLPHRGPLRLGEEKRPRVREDLAARPFLTGESTDPRVSVRRLFIARDGQEVYSTCQTRRIFGVSRGCLKPFRNVAIFVNSDAISAAISAPNHGNALVLAIDDAIDPRSLHLSADGRTATWTINGHTTSAPIPTRPPTS